MSPTNNTTNSNYQYNAHPNSTNNPTGNNTNNHVPPRWPRLPGECDHDGKWGHKREDCQFLKNQFRNTERANVCKPVSENLPANKVEEEVVLFNETPTVRNEELGLMKSETTYEQPIQQHQAK